MRRIILGLLVAVLVPILGGCVPQEQIGGRLLHPNVIIVREFTAPGSAITLDPSFGFSLYRGSAGVPPRERAAGIGRAAGFAVADTAVERLQQLGFDAIRSANLMPEPGARALIVTGTFRQINEGYRRRVGAENSHIAAEVRVDYQGPGTAPQMLLQLRLNSRQLPGVAEAGASRHGGGDLNAAARRIGAELARNIAELARRNQWPMAGA